MEHAQQLTITYTLLWHFDVPALPALVSTTGTAVRWPTASHVVSRRKILMLRAPVIYFVYPFCAAMLGRNPKRRIKKSLACGFTTCRVKRYCNYEHLLYIWLCFVCCDTTTKPRKEEHKNNSCDEKYVELQQHVATKDPGTESTCSLLVCPSSFWVGATLLGWNPKRKRENLLFTGHKIRN